MGRSPCCSKEGLNKGAWTAEEDEILTHHINTHGEGKWRNLPKQAGLKRCGKSCRLRWLNYLRPDIKRGNISQEEEDLIIRLHKLLGNRWSLIAGRLPGRTDNEVKNYWNTTLRKKIKAQLVLVDNNFNTNTESLAKPESTPTTVDQEKPESSDERNPVITHFDVDALLPSDHDDDHHDLWKLYCGGADDPDRRDRFEFDGVDGALGGYRLLPATSSSSQQPVFFTEEMLLEYWTDV